MRNLQALFLLLSVLFVFNQSIPSASQEIEEELSNNEEVPKLSQRPVYLQEDDLCKTGNKQSPIDINPLVTHVKPSLGPLKTFYHPAVAILQNSGHDIKVNWTNGAGHLKIKYKTYFLAQCHWHTPAEHTLSNSSFPLELHMVHISSDGSIAVIGILYEYGHPDPFISTLEKYIKKVRWNQEVEIGGVVDPPLCERNPTYFRYSGSLTTSPCTEGVTWTLLHKVRTASKKQVELLRDALNGKDNSRPVQPINGRKIYLYDPHSDSNGHASS
ncbi:alpha carbonic anhydrase 7-like [Typha latifolia]|uniref:alpha carbonic anhydrase 7-like n=1 Tax=Typha latifolia TaxID=4733 RepID=UPI003C30BA7E